jgi:urease accessory protein
MTVLSLLHLCDSLFPLGAFAYSDGLETATASGAIAGADGLRAWMDVCLDETIGRVDGPVAYEAWAAIHDRRWSDLAPLDAEAIALRPSAAGRRSTRAMGQRLLTTWRTLHPDDRLDAVQQLAADGTIAPSFPVAFAAACAASGVDQWQTVEALAYTRLAATVSAAMRLAPVGQTDAHALLARALDRVPATVAAIAARRAAPESFTPAADLAAMSQQYLHSRLFRS